MRSPILLRAACLLPLCILAGTANAAWHLVESDYFEIYTDLPADQASLLGQDLERFRRVLARITPAPGPLSRLRLRIYAFSGRGDFERTVRDDDVDGIYAPGSHGSVALLYHPRGKRWNIDGRSVLLHEYVHHALRENVGFKYPAWYEEGFAEYLSTFVTSDDMGVIGALPAGRTWILDEFRWMSSEQLVVEGVGYMADRSGARRGVTRGPSTVGDLHMLYALGWFSVHYILSDPDLTQRLGDFLVRMNRGEPAAEAFPAAFERSFDDFDDELKVYWRKDDMALRGIGLKGEDANPPVRVEKLPSLNDRFWIAEAQMYTGYHPDPERMRKAFAKALDALDGAPAAWRERVIVDQAELETDLGEPRAALALLSGLPADAANRARVLYETARAHIALSEFATAGTLLEDALTEFPDDPALLAAFVRIHVLDDEADAGAALARLGHLQAVFPQHESVQFYAALLYAESGRHDRAIESLEWEESFARSDGARENIGRIIEQIERHREASGGEPMPILMGGG